MSFDTTNVKYEVNDKRYEERLPTQVRLTIEEIRVLRECNRESFFYRCVPLGLITTSATYLGVKKGFLKGHPKYGATLKILGAGFLSWVVGKISYRNKCEEKFINLPNSSIGETVRKKRGYVLSEFQKDSYSRQDSNESFFGDDLTSSLPDTNYDASFGALNLDTDKNIHAPGLDDRDRPTTDTFGSLSPDDNQPPKFSTTYDDLRRKNREMHDSQFQKPPSSSISSPPPKMYDSFPQRRPNQSEGSNQNIYGD